MPKDKGLQRRVADLEKELHKLKSLSAPREQDEASISPQSASDNKDYSTNRQSPFAPRIKPAPPNSDKPNKSWYKTLDGWKAALEIIAIPFAIGYAVVSFYQWRALKETVQSNERPYITVPTVTWIPGKNAAQLDFRNSGRGPALNVETHFNTIVNASDDPAKAGEIDPNRLVEFPLRNDPRASSGPLGPGDSAKTDIEPPRRLDLDPVPNRQIYIYGEIDYLDIFGNTYRPRFCVFANGLTDTFHTCQANSFTTAEGHGYRPAQYK